MSTRTMFPAYCAACKKLLFVKHFGIASTEETGGGVTKGRRVLTVTV
jgi:hypothetical protein